VKSAVDYAVYLVTDPRLGGDRSLLSIIEEAVAGGVTVVQIREKHATTRDFVRFAAEAKALLDAANVPMIINDRIDVALAVGASGVHVGQDDMPCMLARKLLGDDAIVGVSVNTPDEARRAEAEGADYLGISPIFDTPTKTDTDPAVGLDGISSIRRATRLPLVGIGGLSAANASEVIRAGANGVAVVSAIIAAADPRAASASLLTAVRCGRTVG